MHFLITEIEVLNLYCNLQVDCFTCAIPGIASYVYTVEHLGAFFSCWVQKHSYILIFFGEPDLNAYHLPWHNFTPLNTAHTYSFSSVASK